MQMTAATNLIRGTIALIALVVLIGTIALNPFVTGWFGGYFANEKFQAQGVEQAHEKYFRTLCPDYFNASFIDRWTSPHFFDMGWCEDYKDRL